MIGGGGGGRNLRDGSKTIVSDDTKSNEPQKPTTFKGRALHVWREKVRPIVVLVIVLTSFRSAVADWNDVPTGSMKPSIVEGDRIRRVFENHDGGCICGDGDRRYAIGDKGHARVVSFPRSIDFRKSRRSMGPFRCPVTEGTLAPSPGDCKPATRTKGPGQFAEMRYRLFVPRR